MKSQMQSARLVTVNQIQSNGNAKMPKIIFMFSNIFIPFRKSQRRNHTNSIANTFSKPSNLISTFRCIANENSITITFVLDMVSAPHFVIRHQPDRKKMPEQLLACWNTSHTSMARQFNCTVIRSATAKKNKKKKLIPKWESSMPCRTCVSREGLSSNRQLCKSYYNLFVSYINYIKFVLVTLAAAAAAETDHFFCWTDLDRRQSTIERNYWQKRQRPIECARIMALFGLSGNCSIMYNIRYFWMLQLLWTQYCHRFWRAEMDDFKRFVYIPDHCA